MSNACGDPVAPDGPVQFDVRRDREQMFERHEPAKGDVVFARLRAETERRHREAVDAFAAGGFSSAREAVRLESASPSRSCPPAMRCRPVGTGAERRSMSRACATVMRGMVLWTIGATVLSAQGPVPPHDNPYASADIAYGATVYAAKCVTCHGAQGDAIGGVNLRSGTFRNAVIDRDLERFIRNGSPAGMPPFALNATDMAGILAYLRNMNAFDPATVKAGDEARGRAIVLGKGACTGCHRIDLDGSLVGPNLSDIGAQRSAGSIQRSLLDPTSQMMPINRPVRVVTKDGTIINGRRLNEDTFTLQIIDDHERLHSLVKADLREFTIAKTSPMPSYKGKLSDEELGDVLAYLLSLKGR